MESKLKILQKQTLLGKTFNIYGDLQNPLFLAKDVAEWIEHSDVSTMVRTVDIDEKLVQTLFVSGQNREVILLTEEGVYEVLMQSRKPIAKQFKKGVKEILKSIRKHGVYLTPQKVEEVLLNPDTIIQLATNLKEEQARRLQVEKEIEKLKPKAELMDKIIDSEQKIDIGQAAKILNLPYGRNKLFQKLRKLGIFFKGRNEPKQEYIERKYFEMKEKWIDRNTHEGFTVIKVLVTQKGLEFLNNLLNGNKSKDKSIKIL